MNSEQTSTASTAPWQREFFKNIDVFKTLGIEEDRARFLLDRFLELGAQTTLPAVMESFRDPAKLDEVGVFTAQEPTRRDFIIEFFDPFIKDFEVEGLENLKYIMPLVGKFPLVLISNHSSHLDAPAIFLLLNRMGGDAQKLAKQLVFIAGRLVFEPDFTRLALYMFDTIMVCSKADMTENPAMADMMTRINMRAFRQATQMQKEGRVISIFPEGTRSRTGRLVRFVDTVYHYVANKVIIPISLSGTAEILPTTSFLFGAARGKMTIGRPVLAGELSTKQMKDLPDYVQRLTVPERNKKEGLIDQLALIVGGSLHKHRHGTYRNLYRGDTIRDDSENILIKENPKATHRVVVIGHTASATAIASVLANKDASIHILIGDEEKASEFNDHAQNLDHFPIYKLPPNIKFTADADVISRSTLLIQAAPPSELASYYDRIADCINHSKSPIVNVVKGFTHSAKGLILDDLVDLYRIAPERLAVLAGANYPEHIIDRKISGFEMAAVDPALLEKLLPLFNTGYVFSRVAVNSNDVRGVQLGGALKNIYAIGTWLIDGFYEKRLGGNNDASLFHVSNRMFQEMSAIGVALGGKESTFFGLSGLTDFMLACFGQDSRDRKFGHDFVNGHANPDRMSNGLFGVRALPRLLPLDPRKYPVASTVHSVLVEKRDFGDQLWRVAERLRRF